MDSTMMKGDLSGWTELDECLLKRTNSSYILSNSLFTDAINGLIDKIKETIK